MAVSASAAAGDAQPLEGEWSIEFTAGGPTLPTPLNLADLKSWTDLEGDELKAFSGTARYTLQFARPEGDAHAWQLDLGAVDRRVARAQPLAELRFEEADVRDVDLAAHRQRLAALVAVQVEPAAVDRAAVVGHRDCERMRVPGP